MKQTPRQLAVTQARKNLRPRPLAPGDRVLFEGEAHTFVLIGADGLALIQRADGKRPSWGLALPSELVRM